MAIKQEDYVFQMKNETEEHRQEILKHYALFLQYYWSEGPLSQTALAHYIFIDCAVSPQEIAVYFWNKKLLSNREIFYEVVGEFDRARAINNTTSKEYCRKKAKEIIKQISLGGIDKGKMQMLLEAMVLKDQWFQQVWRQPPKGRITAGTKKKFFSILQKGNLKGMPEPIGEINEYYLKKLSGGNSE